ncbi:hypothetical protein Tco_0520973 [Tanacetum coccineum]
MSVLHTPDGSAQKKKRFPMEFRSPKSSFKQMRNSESELLMRLALILEKGKLPVRPLVKPCLRGRSEGQYTTMEKLVISLPQRKQKVKKVLRPFNCCNYGSVDKAIIDKIRNSGRMLKVGKFEWKEYEHPNTGQSGRRIKKGHILADFIVEHDPDDESQDHGSGAGMILTLRNELNAVLPCGLGLWLPQLIAEYEQYNSWTRLLKKVSGMIQYLKKVKKRSACTFKGNSQSKSTRSENKKADALSKIASTSFAHLRILSEDKKKARVVRRKASRYTIINGTLYKKSFLGPWLRGKREIVSDNGKQFRDNPFKDCPGNKLGPHRKKKRVNSGNSRGKSKAKWLKVLHSKVRALAFRPEGNGLRSNDASHAKEEGRKTLALNGKGPYEVRNSFIS